MRTVGRPLTGMVSGCPPLRESSTRAPYFSFFSVSNMRQHLAREHLQTLARQRVRHRADLAAGQAHADAQLLAVVVDLLNHRLGAADDGVHALLHVLPGLVAAVEELAAVLEDRRRRARRRVAGRRRRDAL